MILHHFEGRKIFIFVSKRIDDKADRKIFKFYHYLSYTLQDYNTFCKYNKSKSEGIVTVSPGLYDVIWPTRVIMSYQPGLISHFSVFHIFRSINCRYIILVNRLKYNFFDIWMVFILQPILAPLDLILGLWLITRPILKKVVV